MRYRVVDNNDQTDGRTFSTMKEAEAHTRLNHFSTQGAFRYFIQVFDCGGWFTAFKSFTVG